LIYLDTHVVVWLFAGDLKKITSTSEKLINENELYICPMVRLELQYLLEIERITCKANDIISDLSDRIGIRICDKNFNTIVNGALDLSWTRDPFDRIIVSHAALNNNILITKDQNILKNYKYARW